MSVPSEESAFLPLCFKMYFTDASIFVTFYETVFIRGFSVMTHVVFFSRAPAGGSRAEPIPFPFFFYQLSTTGKINVELSPWLENAYMAA